MGEQAYKIAETDNDDHYWKLLVGPDGWECFLGEPEDCNWMRDGHGAVDRLNEQHAEIATLRAENQTRFTELMEAEGENADLRARVAELEAALRDARTSLIAVAAHSVQPMIAKDAREVVVTINTRLAALEKEQGDEES